MVPAVSIIIPVHNCLAYTQQCLEALLQNTPRELYELIVVDNGSSDGTSAFLQNSGTAASVITNSQNVGFAKACNQGAAKASGKYLLFLNNDTQPGACWLEALIAVIETDAAAGIVGSKLLYPDGTVQHAGVAFFNDLTPIHLYAGCRGQAQYVNKKRYFAAVTAACMLIPTHLFKSAGQFDEGYINGLEDIDLCLKVGRLGWKVVYCPQSTLVHHEGKTPGRKANAENNIQLFKARWNSYIHQDDFVFLLQDGMELFFRPDSTEPQFLEKELVDRELLPHLIAADEFRDRMLLEDAIAIYAQLCRICPNRIEFLGRAAEVGLKLGKFVLTMIAAQRIINQKPDDAGALEWLSAARAALKNMPI